LGGITERMRDWVTAPAPIRIRQRAAICLVVLAGFLLIAATPVPGFHWLYQHAVRSDADGRDPLYSAPVDAAALRRAGPLMPEDATYYVHAGPTDLVRQNVGGAARLFLTPAVRMSRPADADWILSHGVANPLPVGLRAARTIRLGERVYLIRVRPK
jgi:hypothetical protein